MKRSVIISLLLVIIQLPSAAQPGSKVLGEGKMHIRYGVEWGYSATFLNNFHSVYFDPDAGYRIDQKGTDFFLYSNGYVSAKAGVELFRHYSATIIAGYAGIKQDRRIVPVSLRAGYHFNSYDTSGSMVFIEGGAGLHPLEETASFLYKAGFGYRVMMSRKSSLDFMASVYLAGDHPGIYNQDIPGYIPGILVRRSDACYAAISFSIAINF